MKPLEITITVELVSLFWGRTVITDGCWEWKGHKLPSGYGRFKHNKRQYIAHRVSYLLHKGEIPEGLVIDHVCRNRACVNPEHLEAVTMKENIMRSPVAPASVNANKTHCQKGHEFTPENTRYARRYEPRNPEGLRRVCIACKKLHYRNYGKEYHRLWRARKKASGFFIGKKEKL